MCASRENVDNVSVFLLLKAHSNGKRATIHTSSISTGVDATQSIAADREKAGVQVNTEMASPPSELLNDTPTDWYPRRPYDPSIGADQVDMQVDFSTAMDKGTMTR